MHIKGISHINIPNRKNKNRFNLFLFLMSSLIKGNKIIGKYDNRTPAKRPDKKYPKYNDDIFLNLKIK